MSLPFETRSLLHGPGHGCRAQLIKREFERACRQLGFAGAMVFSNINGVGLSDPRFRTVWETANDLGAVIHIHPTSPVGVEAMKEYWLVPLVGFPLDTTLAAASLLFSGVAARFPRIRWVLGHLGGAIPYLVERLDRGFHAQRVPRSHRSSTQCVFEGVLLRLGEL